ncbi:MAG: esterase/lipase family protein [Candidatus Dormibacteria bacterium]
MTATLRPSLALFISEPGRALADYGAMLAASPLLLRAPRGDGHPVLVLPGLLAEDASTATMRAYLRSLGYEVHGWRLGRNLGPTAAILAGMRGRLDELHRRSGKSVSLVGWSLGGIFGRELARSRPELVRQVITLGSPFGLTAAADSRADATYRRLGVLHVSPDSLPSREGLSRPIPVPTTAVYSRLDGVVPWQACMNPPGRRRENVAVYSSHLGMGHNAAVLWVIADRLASPDGAWQPFRPPSLARHLFPERPAAA